MLPVAITCRTDYKTYTRNINDMHRMFTNDLTMYWGGVRVVINSLIFTPRPLQSVHVGYTAVYMG